MSCAKKYRPLLTSLTLGYAVNAAKLSYKTKALIEPFDYASMSMVYGTKMKYLFYVCYLHVLLIIKIKHSVTNRLIMSFGKIMHIVQVRVLSDNQKKMALCMHDYIFSLKIRNAWIDMRNVNKNHNRTAKKSAIFMTTCSDSKRCVAECQEKGLIRTSIGQCHSKLLEFCTVGPAVFRRKTNKNRKRNIRIY